MIRAGRVLIAIHDLGAGGAERVASGLANHWSNTGVETGVVTLGSAPDFYPLGNAVERLRVVERTGGGSTVAALAANARRLRDLRRVVQSFAPGVVVSFMTTTNVLVILATRGLGVRVVVAERTWPPMMPLGAAWHRLRRATYRLADRVVVLTERTREWACTELGLARSRVTVIPNPVQLPLPGYATDDRPPRPGFVLAVGRLGPEKDFAALIEACAELGAVELVILGEGPERPALLAAAARLGVRLSLPGQVGNPARWYRAARCLALTSRFEGFPNVLLEAMSHGCPVVSVDCEVGPREIVRDEVDGLLVPPGNRRLLAAALGRLLEDDQLQMRLGRAAVEVALRFSAATVYAAWSRAAGVAAVD